MSSVNGQIAVFAFTCSQSPFAVTLFRSSWKRSRPLAVETVTSFTSPLAALKVTGPKVVPWRRSTSAVAVAAEATDGRRAGQRE